MNYIRICYIINYFWKNIILIKFFEGGDWVFKMSIGYKNLDVWNRAYDHTLIIYNKTKRYPDDEKFGLLSQMRRASTSIITNLAEGYGKNSLKDFIRFVSISIGSYNELEVCLLLSKDLGYLSDDDYNKLNKEHDIIGKMLFSLRKGLKRKLDRITPASRNKPPASDRSNEDSI